MQLIETPNMPVVNLDALINGTTYNKAREYEALVKQLQSIDEYEESMDEDSFKRIHILTSLGVVTDDLSGFNKSQLLKTPLYRDLFSNWENQLSTELIRDELMGVKCK